MERNATSMMLAIAIALTVLLVAADLFALPKERRAQLTSKAR